MDMALISLRDVGVAAPRTLFQNLTFTLAAGDRIGLIAGNGGGKSTLLRCLAGLAEPDAGSVTLSRSLRVGFVEQDLPDALLRLTLHEAVRRALPPAAREHEAWRVGAVLDEFEAPADLRDRLVGALSGGGVDGPCKTHLGQRRCAASTDRIHASDFQENSLPQKLFLEKAI